MLHVCLDRSFMILERLHLTIHGYVLWAGTEAGTQSEELEPERAQERGSGMEGNRERNRTRKRRLPPFLSGESVLFRPSVLVVLPTPFS